MAWLFLIISIIYFLLLFMIYFEIHYFSNNIGEESLNNISKNYLFQVTNITELKNITNFQTYYYDDKNDAVQPINFILITNKDPLTLFLGKGWFENKIFGKDKISIKDFYGLLKNKTSPMSILFLNGRPQEESLQFKSDSLFKREHLRLWKFAKLRTITKATINNTNESNQKTIYLGSISEDQSLTFVFYNYFITPIHKINPFVDDSREFLLTNIIKNTKKEETIICHYQPLGLKKDDNSLLRMDINYQTDGRILVCEY